MSQYAGDLTPQQAWELLAHDDDAVLVDVRTPGEWVESGIPDLTELNRDTVLDTVATTSGAHPDFLAGLVAEGLAPGDGRTIVFICKSGGRSLMAAKLATGAGFGPSYNVLEGFVGGSSPDVGWAGSGLPVTRWVSE